MTKRLKRPRDPAQLAKPIVDIATGQVEDRRPSAAKSPTIARRGRIAGLKGGKARAKALTPEQRNKIARFGSSG